MNRPPDDFDKRFAQAQRDGEKRRKTVLTGMVVIGTLGAGFVGFICWAIYRLVSHFTSN